MYFISPDVPKVNHVDPLSNSPGSDDSDEYHQDDFVPFDLEEQRSEIAHQRWRHHIQWCDRMNESQRMTHNNRRISLQILVNEAFHRDVSEARRRGDDTSPKELKRMWKNISERVKSEMEHCDNSASVLKNLSCMCVFISDNVCRQYGENVDARVRRIDKMRNSLERLREQGTLFHQESENREDDDN
ncbi:Hypothetical protein, putative [Bodo saltans]|uniref:Uncharacterized protein n=1 Tax=Bodo saltans TaxID=75058 RepID=A0A0S4JCV6_BODSA|nr:Hypothetical protein, putative [Bodo saltans]|eukprot:CUG88232.1 Hypothetical protein, putative [Bodo saltans]